MYKSCVSCFLKSHELISHLLQWFLQSTRKSSLPTSSTVIDGSRAYQIFIKLNLY